MPHTSEHENNVQRRSKCLVQPFGACSHNLYGDENSLVPPSRASACPSIYMGYYLALLSSASVSFSVAVTPLQAIVKYFCVTRFLVILILLCFHGALASSAFYFLFSRWIALFAVAGAAILSFISCVYMGRGGGGGAHFVIYFLIFFINFHFGYIFSEQWHRHAPTEEISDIRAEIAPAE